MGSRRTLIIVAAVALGAMAAFVIYGYVGGIQDRAYGEAAKVKVFVVKTTVTRGQYGEEAQQQRLIVEDEIPKRYFPPNAIRSFDDLDGKAAVSDLATNQIVTTDMFADPTTVQSTFADRLEKINKEDQVAITISVDDVHGVAQLLQPGDYVNVLLKNICSGDAGAAAGSGSTGGDAGADGAPVPPPDEEACSDTVLFEKQARVLYQKVQILAIGQTPVAQPGEVEAASEGEEGEASDPAAQNKGLVTLIVPARAAQYLASVEGDRLYLTLVSRDYKPTPQAPIDPNEGLPAEDPSALTPYGPEGPEGE